MTDPYGRTQVPKKPKMPRYFSPIRPFKVFVGIWLFAIGYFYWKLWTLEANKHTPMFFLAIIGIMVISLPLLCLINIIGVWTLIPFAILHLFNFAIAFAFHLNSEEGWEYWKEKLFEI